MLNIIQMPNSNFFPGRNGYKAKWIILHGTASNTAPGPAPSAQNIANFFASTQGGGNPVSSHYVIGIDGTIVQCVSEADGAWANGYLTPGHDPWWNTSINPNNITISIEHVKPASDNSDALTPAQETSSFALVADICARNGIPARAADASGGITGHYSIDPVNRSRCPGTYNWDDLWPYLQGGNMTGVPTGWTDDGSTLTAPNGHKVIQGFRSYILSNSWDASNYPLEEEHAQSPLEASNPTLGSGTQQVFRTAMLGWTPARGVFAEWIGQELITLRTQKSPSPSVSSALSDVGNAIVLLQDAQKQLSS